MESIIEIAYYILMIGGAICVVLLFLLLVYVLGLLFKIKSMVNGAQHWYQQMMTFGMVPLQKITERLSEEDDPDDDDDDDDDDDW